MRFLKKYIKKLYHLIWFLGVFFLFLPYANAIVTIDGARFTQSSYVAFADNTNGFLTRINSVWLDYGSYYRSESSILTNGSNYYGANWAFYSDVPFVSGHTYAISVLIGMANTYAITNSSSNNRICIAENLANAFGRYNNPAFPCTTAWSISTNSSTQFTDNNVAYNYTILSYIFTADFTSNAITGVYNSAVSNESNHTFGGYIVEELSSQPLTQSQITSAVQNSGLATASSVSQVQSSINQIQQDINSSANNIINNNNQNTQDIINSSGSNTQSIIDNQNENSNKEIESQKVCKSVDKKDIITDGKFFNTSNGGTYNSPSYGISSYLDIYGATITIKNIFNYTNPSIYGCYYDTNKTLISCQKLNNISSLTIPSNAHYFRSSIDKNSNKPTYEICKNGNQALNDSVNDLNDNITDSNIDSSDDTINNLKNQIPTNSVISDLLLLPVRFLQNFVNALGSSCSTFSLGSLYGTELFMPCINIENYLGNAIWTAIDLIISGMFVYALRKKFIEIYENLTNLKNGGNEVD